MIPNLGVKVDPLLKEFNDQVYNTPDKVEYFILGAKDDLIGTLSPSQNKSDQNIIAGSTADDEIKTLEAAFEKIKPTLKFENN